MTVCKGQDVVLILCGVEPFVRISTIAGRSGNPHVSHKSKLAYRPREKITVTKNVSGAEYDCTKCQVFDTYPIDFVNNAYFYGVP